MSLSSIARSLPDAFFPLYLKAPAKVNLFLRITGKRADGYHELQSLMCPISLCDEICLCRSRGGVRLTVHGGGGQVPETPDNLASKAAVAFCAATGYVPDLDIYVKKKIPVSAGLGGGSSDAAAVLSALNRVCGYPLSGPDLAALALSLGADVPFFLMGGAAWAEGIGECLESLRNIQPYPLVLVNPGVPLSTQQVYKNLKWGLTKEGIKTKKPHFEEALMDPLPWLFNDLEPVAISMCPEVDTARSALISAGASRVLVSGSGPTVFGVFSEDRMAMEAEAFLAGCCTRWIVIAAHLMP
ncbi:4-(cytidine 5'-diphospho)-2-C-methyl-D-erythritol kinase [Desulfobotulus sp. H1]|uniref:4-diphosphocytidyl-2-C-methyl-D-erythritol kinase n=1 Tax=Desulfobotulus pelophilus TaxID=2823377 RepID=A0ABT3NAQ2_9BACT|nr:4-(cytidine 5'-diphospho)-2-C-methyl-D-erythritol kinase [Desulfobotulus pelophilus]MCW7754542.1 4-(cytidine 5'-diphospho)-2-C-methyl-D-erythritol kinase [Desulfobotulus pelophilus]